MVLAIRSEFRKFFTTRMWWGMGLAVVSGAYADVNRIRFDGAFYRSDIGRKGLAKN